jgi:hypothetical protein
MTYLVGIVRTTLENVFPKAGLLNIAQGGLGVGRGAKVRDQLC